MNTAIFAFVWGAVAMAGTAILRHSHKGTGTWTRGTMVGTFICCHLLAPVVLAVAIIALCVVLVDWVTKLTYKPRKAWIGWWGKPGW